MSLWLSLLLFEYFVWLIFFTTHEFSCTCHEIFDFQIENIYTSLSLSLSLRTTRHGFWGVMPKTRSRAFANSFCNRVLQCCNLWLRFMMKNVPCRLYLAWQTEIKNIWYHRYLLTICTGICSSSAQVSAHNLPRYLLSICIGILPKGPRFLLHYLAIFNELFPELSHFKKAFQDLCLHPNWATKDHLWSLQGYPHVSVCASDNVCLHGSLKPSLLMSSSRVSKVMIAIK